MHHLEQQKIPKNVKLLSAKLKGGGSEQFGQRPNFLIFLNPSLSNTINLTEIALYLAIRPFESLYVNLRS